MTKWQDAGGEPLSREGIKNFLEDLDARCKELGYTIEEWYARDPLREQEWDRALQDLEEEESSTG